MEFEIDLKLKVSIKDHETNVNEIARAVKEVVGDTAKEVLKEISRVYQLRKGFRVCVVEGWVR